MSRPRPRFLVLAALAIVLAVGGYAYSTVRKPLVLVSGRVTQLPSGDTIAVTLPPTTCGSGSAVTAIGSDGTGACGAVGGGGGSGVTTTAPLSGTTALTLLYGTGLTLSGSNLIADIATGLTLSGNHVIADLGTGVTLSGNHIIADISTGLTLSANHIVVDNTVEQARVTGTCTAPNAVTSVSSTGTVTCSTGTVTTSVGALSNFIAKYTTGTNLAASLLFDDGSTLKYNSTFFTVTTAGVGAFKGALTADTGLRVFDTAGTGLTSTANTVSADTTYLQRIVTGTCGAGTHMTGVTSVGGVTCDYDTNAGMSEFAVGAAGSGSDVFDYDACASTVVGTCQITPTSDLVIHGILNEQVGRVIVLQDADVTGGHAVSLVNEDASETTASRRIHTLDGNNLKLVYPQTATIAELTVNSNTRWYVLGVETMPVGAGVINTIPRYDTATHITPGSITDNGTTANANILQQAGNRVFSIAGTGLTSSAATVSLNIAGASCSAGQFVSAIGATGTGTCTAAGGTFDPTTAVTYFADFVNGNSASASPWDGVFMSNFSGTGAQVQPLADEQGHPGILRLGAGTTTTGRAALIVGGNSSSAFLFGVGAHTFDFLIRPQTLCDGTTDICILDCGFLDTVTGESVDGAYLKYNPATSANWRTVVVSNSVATEADSSPAQAVAANTWVHLAGAVNAAGTSVSFTVAGIAVGTVTTNIPTGAGRNFGAGCTIVKSAGTNARTFDVDYGNIVVSGLSR